MRIALAILAIAAVFILIPIGPDRDHAYAEIHCNGSDSPPAATLPDMNACMAETRRVKAWQYCSCLRPTNSLAWLYYNVFFPLVLAVTAALTLRGRLLVQVIQFVAAAAVGIYGSLLLASKMEGYFDEEAADYFLIGVTVLASGAFILFLAFRGVSAGFRAWKARVG
jgi:hypothetical protein